MSTTNIQYFYSYIIMDTKGDLLDELDNLDAAVSSAEEYTNDMDNDDDAIDQEHSIAIYKLIKIITTKRTQTTSIKSMK